MSEKLLVGNIFYTDDGLGMCNKKMYGDLTVLTRNSIGQGWGFDLKNISPDDLRVLADFLEKRQIEMELKNK